MNHIDVMKQWLYALEMGRDAAFQAAEMFHLEMRGYKQQRHEALDAEVKQIDEAITALRTAIEAAEKQEPVGYFSVNDYGNWEQNESGHGEPFYTAPPAAPCNPAEDGICEALDCCKQQLEDARTEAVALRVNEQNLIAALEAEREAIAQFFEQHYRDRWTDVEIVEAIRARSTT